MSTKGKSSFLRRAVKVLAVLLILLILLVIFAPTLAGMSFVRNIVVGKINEHLNGSVEIDDWSLGWASGASLSGVRVYDDHKQLILKLGEVKTGVTLLAALRGDYDIGATTVDAELTDCRIDAQGNCNYARLAKTEPTQTVPTSAAPAKATPSATAMPAVKGSLTIRTLSGTITDEKSGHVIHLDAATSASLKLVTLQQPIETNLKLIYRVDQAATASTLGAAGTFNAGPLLGGSPVTIDAPTIAALIPQQKLTLDHVDLGAANIGLQMAKVNLTLAGTAQGSLDLSGAGGALNAKGEITVAQLSVGGPLMQGDTYATAKLDIPIDVAMTGAGSAAHVKATIKALLDQGSLGVDVDAPAASLANLAQNLVPQQEGVIELDLDVPGIAELARQLPHLARLQDQVMVTNGQFTVHMQAKFTKEQTQFRTQLSAQLQGTRDGQPATIQPIQSTIAATMLPNHGGPLANDVRDLEVAFSSGFAQASGGGPSIAKLNVTGSADLGKLQAELGQFVKFGDVKLAGTQQFTLSVVGDATAPDQPLLAQLRVAGADLNLCGAQVPYMLLSAAANLQRSGQAHITGAQGVQMTLDVGQSAQSLYAHVALSDAALQPGEGALMVVKGNVAVDMPDLAKLMNALQALPDVGPKLGEFLSGPHALSLQGGTASIKLSLRRNGDDLATVTDVAATGLTATDAQGRGVLNNAFVNLHAQVAVHGAQAFGNTSVQAEVGDAARSLLKLVGTGQMFAPTAQPTQLVDSLHDAKVDLTAADLPKLVAWVRGLPGVGESLGKVLVEAGATPPPGAVVLNGGGMSVSVVAHRDAAGQPLAVQLDGGLTGLTLADSHGAPLVQTTNVTLGAHAQVGAGNTLGNVAAIVEADSTAGDAYAKLSISDAALNPSGAPLDMIQKATLSVDVPDLVRLLELVRGMPGMQTAMVNIVTKAPATPAADANDPYVVRSAAVNLRTTLRRDTSAGKSYLNDGTLTINNLALSRGAGTYTAKAAQTIKFAAEAAGADVAAVTAAKVTQLDAALDFGAIKLQEPLSVAWANSQLSAAGKIQISGDIGALNSLFAVLQGKAATDSPASGTFVITETAQTDAGIISLAGQGSVSKLNATSVGADGTKHVFAEDQLGFANDLTLRRDKDLLELHIKTFTVDMQSSDALHVSAGGSVTITGAAYTFDKAHVDITADLGKVWTLAQGWMSKGMLKSIGDMQIVGKTKRTFFVDGSYACLAPMNQAIAGLTAYGTLGADQVDLNTYGVHLKNVDIPVSLRQGHLRIAYGDRAGGADAPKPFAANNGTIDLAGGDLDLTKDHPTLNWASNHQLLQGFELNEVAVKMLQNVSPLFHGADQASGTMALTIADCAGLPIDGTIADKNSTGKADLVLSMRNLQVSGGTMLSLVKLAGTFLLHMPNVLQGDVNGATVAIAGGHVKHNLPLALGGGQAMIFNGDMRIDGQYYDPLSWTIPAAMVRSGPLGGGGLTLHFKGPVNKLKLDSKATSEDVGKQLLQGLLGGHH